MNRAKVKVWVYRVGLFLGALIFLIQVIVGIQAFSPSHHSGWIRSHSAMEHCRDGAGGWIANCQLGDFAEKRGGGFAAAGIGQGLCAFQPAKVHPRLDLGIFKPRAVVESGSRRIPMP